jgi:4-hydroxy-3-polyprenylbenzoate decarboxylase
MIVIPCSMKTLAGIRAGYAEGLVGRAADVVLKEGASWCWSRVKCRSARSIWKHAGAVPHGRGDGAAHARLLQPPKTVDDITNHIVTRVLDQFGLEYHKARRWNGLRAAENLHRR